MSAAQAPSAESVQDELSALIATLHKTEQRLEELTAGEVDTVADRDGKTLVLRRAQEQLRQTEALRQATLLNALPAHIALLDANGVVVSVNDSWKQFGPAHAAHAPGHPTGANYLVLCDEAQAHGFAEASLVAAGIRAVLRGERNRFRIEYECPSPQGARWFQLSVTPLEPGRSNGIVVVHSDVTERKRDQDALRDLNAELEDRVRVRTAELALARDAADGANHAKSLFLATMSHEIRTPMNGVIGMVDVLQQTRLDSDQQEMVELVHDSANSLLKVIEDILDFSKIEAGRMSVEKEPMPLARLVRNVCAMLKPVAVKAGVALDVVIDPTIPELLQGDDTRVRQVLTNLVGNAIKFSSGGERGGEVCVRADVAERGPNTLAVEVSVVDNGIGIDAETQSRLFTSFMQADASTTRRFGGTGLGLSISHMLVHLMGGEITVRSVPGEGAAFRVRLPFALPDPAVPPPPMLRRALLDGHEYAGLPAAAAFVPGHLAPLRTKGVEPLILVAEDNSINRTVIVRQLQLLGLRSQVAVDGRETLELWRGGDFAMLLTDLHMPEMDGYELATAIRAEEAPGKRMPIIALTANALRDEELRCLAIGMDAYLTKPVRLVALKALMQTWLGDPAETAGADAEGAEPAADLRMLADLVGDDPAALRDILKTFSSTARQSQRQISEGLDAGLALKVAESAHKLKAAARAIGAMRLGAVCAELELIAEAGKMRELRLLRPRFDFEFDALRRLLDT